MTSMTADTTKDLGELLRMPAGRQLLADNMTFLDPADFVAQLARTAAGPGAAGLPVYVHQQPCPDFAPSVIAKFAALSQLAQSAAVSPVFVSIDTDRAASSKIPTRITWLGDDGTRTAIKLTPPGTRHGTFRSIRTDPAQLKAVAARIADLAGASAQGAAGDRLAALLPLLAPAVPLPYGDYAAGLAMVLLARHLRFDPVLHVVSHLQAEPAVRGALWRLLTGVEDFVAAFNGEVAALRAAGVDPGLGPLPTDYLPLFHCSAQTGERRRLHRLGRGAGMTGLIRSRNGAAEAFPLGSETALAAFFATGLGSVDVMLPILLSPLYSGLVAGRSSAFYLLPMRGAMRRVFGESLPPVLLPAALAAPAADPRGLLQRWLMEGPP